MIIITNVATLPNIGNSYYVRTCNSENVTQLNSENYEISIPQEYGYVINTCKGWTCDEFFKEVTVDSGGGQCGVRTDNPDVADIVKTTTPAWFDRIKFHTPCENYDSAYLVKDLISGSKYVLGCPNGLELYDPSMSISSLSTLISRVTLDVSPSISEHFGESTEWIGSTSDFSLSTSPSIEPSASEVEMSSRVMQSSNTIVNLDKAGVQLSVAVILGIVFSSIAVFAIALVLLGIVGFSIFHAASKKGALQEYSFSGTIRTTRA